MHGMDTRMNSLTELNSLFLIIYFFFHFAESVQLITLWEVELISCLDAYNHETLECLCDKNLNDESYIGPSSLTVSVNPTVRTLNR